MVTKIINFLREHVSIEPYKVMHSLNNIDDKETQDKLREHFKHNLADWIDLTVVMKDPDHHPQDRKFLLFPGQKTEIVDWFEETAKEENPRADVKVSEKSRRIGWTNTLLACYTWAALFWSRSTIICTKDHASADKKGDDDNTLLPRIRKIIDMQPYWLRKKYEDPEGHIIFGDCSIVGVATQNPEAASKLGRQARVRYVHFDEAAFWSSYYLELAYGACAQTCKFRIVISTAADTHGHFFSKLVDGEAVEHVRGKWIPHTINPANNDRWLSDQKRTNTRESFEREIYGKRGSAEARVFTRFIKDSYRDNDDKHWTINHEWIKKELEKPGYYFASFDGGAGFKTKAAIIGYHIEESNRDILLKEIISTATDTDGRDLQPVSMSVRRFIERYCDDRELKLYGDPALANLADHEVIKAVFSKEINLLDTLRPGSPGYISEYAGIFTNRMEKRIGRLGNDLDEKLADNLPQIILLNEDDNKMFGCPLLFEGLFQGAYQWKREKGIIVMPRKLEQNHPIVDIVDAYSYYVLETRPTMRQHKSPIMQMKPI